MTRVRTCICLYSSHQTVLSTRRRPAHPVSALILHARDASSVVAKTTETDSNVVPGRQPYYNPIAIVLGYDRHNILCIGQLRVLVPRYTEREKKQRQRNTNEILKEEKK